MKRLLKIYLTFYILFYSLSAFTQTIPLLDQKNHFEGRYYISEASKSMMSEQHMQDEDSTAFIIRIIPPVFDTSSITITLDSIENKEILDGKIRWNISPEYTNYKRYPYYEECLNVQPELGRGICIQKEKHKPAFEIIHLDSLKKKSNTLQVFTLISNGRIEKEIVSKKPRNLSDNEYYFPKKVWSSFTAILCCLKSSPSTLEIEKALKERGYESNLNGELDEIDKKSLLQFQKDNGLSTGNLNMDTLRALELEY